MSDRLTSLHLAEHTRLTQTHQPTISHATKSSEEGSKCEASFSRTRGETSFQRTRGINFKACWWRFSIPGRAMVNMELAGFQSVSMQANRQQDVFMLAYRAVGAGLSVPVRRHGVGHFRCPCFTASLQLELLLGWLEISMIGNCNDGWVGESSTYRQTWSAKCGLGCRSGPTSQG